MSESVVTVPQNGLQLPNGIQLENGLHRDLNPWRRIKARLGKRARRVIRVLLVILIALLIFLLLVEPVAASAVARHQGVHGRALISLGRYAREAKPFPVPDVLPVEQIDTAVSYTYARVVQENAPVYAHPEEAVRNLPPKRLLAPGFVWVSVQGKTTYAGEDYYQINAGEYVKSDVLSFYQPSAFQGVALVEQPSGPFAWILTAVQPSRTAAGEANAEAPVYQRYHLVQILATETNDDQVWYQLGPEQWINQIYVGKVTPSAPPEGVAPDEKWIEVNLFEQTLAAYEGDRMVYATLVSSGLPGWNTPVGLNRVWLKVISGKMSGGEGRPDYYFLEDVPWTMYFNNDVALHTAYWHDGFGYKHSHGCVNLPPLDAQWLFQWAPEDVWVWVH
jgi:lipoprotein-anchoring transpeptidase ErfK/SrfK